ncbi:unnamed protein product [Rhizoctonia solani]|uniref:Uncharacterized protein n=1 Tax=Rhizoctonia solani TaxID=456999 RepID=A0A8H3HZT6_9AGAM|nr:unnamed protein product [Rhizoctonia solani]
METQSNQASCATIRRWEEAGLLLSRAFKSYFDSCSHLESKYQADDGNPTDLVSRIDSTLDSLHIRLEQQLAESRSTLVRTRNRRASSFFKFPAEILAELFLNVIFVPTPAEYMDSPDMGLAVKTIYRRLHALSGVCTVWRNILINYKAAWQVVPLIDHEHLGHKRLTTDLSLERGGDALHLAAIQTYEDIPTDWNVLSKHAHRFCSVNISSNYPSAFRNILNIFLESKYPIKLSELSICDTEFHEDHVSNLYDSDLASNPLFDKLFESLSVLRLSGISICWDRIKFSACLTELDLDSVPLGNISQLTDFLQAASSAPELHDLKINTVHVITSETPPPSSPTFCFPKLQDLFLGVVNYHVLRVILGTIVPGSHRVNFIYWGDQPYYLPNWQGVERVESDTWFKLLKAIKIDTLMLVQRSGALPMPFGRLLRSMPWLKVLKFANWEFRKGDWDSLMEFESGVTPELEELHIWGARLDDIDLIQLVVRCHWRSLRKLVIGGYIPLKTSGNHNGAKLSLEEARPDIVEWLEAVVPEFHLASADYIPEELRRHRWKLW